MKYQIRQKILSFKDSFTIKNENEQDMFVVEGKVFSIGHKLNLNNINGNLLYYIEQKLFKLLPEYYIYNSSVTQVAMIKKKLSFFKPKYIIESDFGVFELNGDILDHNFEVVKNNIVCAVVSKKWFALSDTYGVDINDNIDAAFILSLIIVIDMIIDDQEASRG